MLDPQLAELFHQFDRAGARWCVLRLPAGPGNSDGDVDLLVDPTDVRLMRQVLMGLEFVPVPAGGRDYHFLSYQQPTGRWIWIHIVTELSFGRYSVLQTRAEAGCLMRRERDGAMFTLAPDDAFWVLLLHCLVDKSSIAARHRTRLQALAAVALTKSPLAQVVAAACPDGWTLARILQYARDGRWVQLEQFGPAFTRSWMRRQHIGTWTILLHRVSQLIVKLINLPRSRGLGVALLGPDGAGKTTVIADVQKDFILPVRSVYMGLTGGLLPRADSLRFPVLVAFSRLVIFWCRYLIAQYHQSRGRLVIFDRYIYDAEVPTPYPLSRLKKAYRWMDGHALPAPDLVLVLSAPGEIMYQRKREYNPEMLEDWRQHFLALQKRMRQAEIVDTTRDRDVVRIDVTERIWQQYASRWLRNSAARGSAI